MVKKVLKSLRKIFRFCVTLFSLVLLASFFVTHHSAKIWQNAKIFIANCPSGFFAVLIALSFFISCLILRDLKKDYSIFGKEPIDIQLSIFTFGILVWLYFLCPMTLRLFSSPNFVSSEKILLKFFFLFEWISIILKVLCFKKYFTRLFEVHETQEKT